MLFKSTAFIFALISVGNVLAAPQGVPTLVPWPTLIASSSTPSPSSTPAPPTCDITGYASFKLYGTRHDTREKYPIRLYRDDPYSKNITSYAVINTSKVEPKIYPCYSCGIIPDTWNLKRSHLVPVDGTLSSDYTTLSKDVKPNGRLPFVAAVGGNAVDPIYCAAKSQIAYETPFLGVHGSYEDFSMCRLELGNPITSIYEIIYKPAPFSVPEYRCIPITITLEFD